MFFQTKVMRSSGFSLIELLAVIAIMAILLVSGYPSFQERQFRAVVNNPTKLLQKGIDKAKEFAKYQKRNVTICASGDQVSCDGAAWQNGWIVFFDDDADGDTDGNEIEFAQTLVRNDDVVITLDLDNRVTFNKKGERHGGLTAGTALFKICHQNNEARYARGIRVNQAGGSYRLTDTDGDNIPNNGANLSCP